MSKIMNIEHQTLENCNKSDWNNILEGKRNFYDNLTPTFSLKNENEQKIKELRDDVIKTFRKENDDFKFQSIPVFDTHPEGEKSDYSYVRLMNYSQLVEYIIKDWFEGYTNLPEEDRDIIKNKLISLYCIRKDIEEKESV